MYEKVVTVFHKFADADGNIFWYPNVINDVDLNIGENGSAGMTGMDDADAASLHIKYGVQKEEKMIGKKRWLPPKKWAMQPKESLGDSITFTTGDFFLEGKYDESVVADADYQDRSNGGFYHYMNKQNDYVFLITSVKGPYTLIPHFEITGA